MFLTLVQDRGEWSAQLCAMAVQLPGKEHTDQRLGGPQIYTGHNGK